MTRPSSEQQRVQLKAATRQAVRWVGTLEAAARITGRSVTRLHAAGNVLDPDYFLPIDAALDLDLDIGRPVVTTALAELQGYVLLHPGGADDGTKIDLMVETATASQDLGQWSSEVLAAMSDGSLTEAELERLIALARDEAARWQVRLQRLLALRNNRMQERSKS